MDKKRVKGQNWRFKEYRKQKIALFIEKNKNIFYNKHCN